MTIRPRTASLALALPLALIVSACGGGAPDTSQIVLQQGQELSSTAGPGDDQADVTADPTDSGDSTAEAAEGVVTSFSDAKPAVVQIMAQGTLRDPEVGLTTTVGSGSGFLISPDGLAVTNNHVVTGASTLEVFIGGDTSEKHTATVLGASECSDLALIQVDVDEPGAYLAWADEPPEPGLDVYAAGFPLGDPEYTLTKGIVSKAQANGDVTGSSSIDHTIEHDATIQPGNSGGPLITLDGEVLAVNYAGGALQEGASKQFWAIAASLAEPMVAELAEGDAESLGINGRPIFDDKLALSGIWVSGVKPGSPASAAGLLPGDIVLSLNAIPMATDGTYRDYCDVLRTSGDNAMTVEVLRWDTAEVLRGEINGSQGLEPILSLAEEAGGDVPQGDAPGDGGMPVPTYYDYVTVTDDTGSLSIDVPTEWNDVQTDPMYAPEGLAFIGASDDMQAFRDGWTHPGLVFYLRPYQGDEWDTLHYYTYEDVCAAQETGEFSDVMYSGVYQIWSQCEGTDGLVINLVLSNNDQTYTAVMTTYVATEADLEAFDRAFASFTVYNN
ncbi:trypsin-like serine protease [Ornithinimicrobium ciconiae]|uniref:Trypsin-like serine protease n=1 Tax=Ornithinimicrobium ciconiae TaxID=2594265 RepID=A0A516G6G7_9MICO|nr:S1C family serine protease [Ornithinimicrobium ciconiae]QDO87126.1 trypsin-like serine protease [Ornithinimicrobium ciconiae]